MMPLQTQRLWLLETSVAIMKKRLQQEDFFEVVSIQQKDFKIHFSKEWPGDALDMFPQSIKYFESNPTAQHWGGTIVDKQSLEVVGGMGFKGGPNEIGEVEIGYGINPSWQNRGIATEMLAAMCEWALAQATIKTVLAETAVWNIASKRVLIKNGFVHHGVGYNEEDGDLDLWKLG